MVTLGNGIKSLIPDKIIKCYIAGPMTGLPDYNHAAFEQAKKHVLARHMRPVSPADVSAGWTDEQRKAYTWNQYMQMGFISLLGCQAIMLLPGWEASRGAPLELQVALACGMDVYMLTEIGTVIMLSGRL